MKENFSELYTRLYKENFEELEGLRAEAKKQTAVIIFIIAGLFVLGTINPLLLVIGIAILIVKFLTGVKQPKKTNGKSYAELYKEKIVGPIIENAFEGAKYEAKRGLSRYDYDKAGFKERVDRYSSEDLILAHLKIDEETSTIISFAEVHTERESTDEDGRTTYHTIFRGLAGSFLIPKDIGKKIYIRANGRVSRWNKSKVKMDMPEFERIFDVESDDPIITMRVLTADVMAEMIDLYQKYKYRFEINILNDTVYMRLSTGAMFEPNVFKSSLEYKRMEKYYMVLKALTKIATHIYDTISKLEV